MLFSLVLKMMMNWIYELAESILGVSHDWAVLIVQLCLVFSVIILLGIFKPWPLPIISNFVEKIGERTTKYYTSSVQTRLINGYIQYWHQWGSAGLTIRQARLQKRMLDAGVDWILETCITYNIQGGSNNKPIGFKFSDLERVTAAWAGYIQGQRKWTIYRWIIELQNGQFIYLRAWFDPARSYGEPRTMVKAWTADTAEEAAQIEIRPEVLRRNEPIKKEQHHLMDQVVYEALLNQIETGERDWAGFKGDTVYAP